VQCHRAPSQAEAAGRLTVSGLPAPSHLKRRPAAAAASATQVLELRPVPGFSSVKQKNLFKTCDVVECFKFDQSLTHLILQSQRFSYINHHEIALIKSMPFWHSVMQIWPKLDFLDKMMI
jgi:hypothetical protein